MKQWMKWIVIGIGMLGVVGVLILEGYEHSIDSRGTYIDSYFAYTEDGDCGCDDYREYLFTEHSCIERHFHSNKPQKFEYVGVHPIRKWQYIRLLRQAIYNERFFDMKEVNTIADASVEIEIYYGGQKRRATINGSDLEAMLYEFIGEKIDQPCE